ncbi:MAG TPA: ECF-type sigma factor [Candidatus Paceibacterota bacterium]|nr:ECF-type sigma factor [Candidatus Paceibacterota bacterium]
MKPDARPETRGAISPPCPSAQPTGPQVAEVLLPQVYEELRRLAACKMAQEPPGQTLQATALVHEAWLRLAAQDNQTYANRTHFFAVAAEAMRRILIDRARRRRAVRRGGQAQRVDADSLEIAAPAPDDELLALDEALERLAEHQPQKAELVKLRHFVGLTLAEAAEILGISEPTAKRYWAYTRAWLFRELERQRTS